MGTYIPLVHVVEKSPTAEELQLEKAWELHKEHAYTEIDLQVEDQEHVSIRTNHDPVIAWNTLRAVYGNRLANCCILKTSSSESSVGVAKSKGSR